MSDSLNQPRPFEVLTAAPVRARRKPRDWPDEEKERLIAEALLPGANVSAIARADGLDPSQLYGWRRKALSSGLVAPLTDTAKEDAKFPRIHRTGSLWGGGTRAVQNPALRSNGFALIDGLYPNLEEVQGLRSEIGEQTGVGVTNSSWSHAKSS